MSEWDFFSSLIYFGIILAIIAVAAFAILTNLRAAWNWIKEKLGR